MSPVTIKLPDTVIALEYRIINLELVINRIMSVLDKGKITEQDLAELSEKAKEKLHEKYPSVSIE